MSIISAITTFANSISFYSFRLSEFQNFVAMGNNCFLYPKNTRAVTNKCKLVYPSTAYIVPARVAARICLSVMCLVLRRQSPSRGRTGLAAA